ncbi:MAG: hypothetical protein R6V05_09610 [Candidatus Brocadiia bacterium]
MSHLRKSAATGHLLKSAGGHLANSCPATTTASPTTTTTSTTSTTAAPTTTTTAAPTTTTEGPANECNSCDPPLPDTMYVTLSGLAGDLSFANGTHAVQWVSGCLWWAWKSPGKVELWFQSSTGRWYVEAEKATGCYKRWRGPNAECDPGGSYSEETCGDSGCSYPMTCEYSEGATCTVSES